MSDIVFDEIIDRKNTDSIKYDSASSRGLPEDLLPLWVADMDFKAPQCVIDALIEKSRHGIFGYSDSGDDYYKILKEWFKDAYDWDVHKEWLVKTPGVVYSIATATRAFTKEDESILIQEPVYYPFKSTIVRNSRKPVVNELIYDGKTYTIDFSDFENKIVDQHVKMFILCSPHNPIGRVWTDSELKRMGDICRQHGVIVVSDEIHADFIYPGNKHNVFSALRHEYNDFTITCTSPTKTFNLASLQISNIIIPNPALRTAFQREIGINGYSQINVMGIAACKAAYKGASAWLNELKSYLTGNLTFMRQFLTNKLPQIKLIEPEGTYLVWLDFKALNLSDKELEDLIVQKAKLWLDGGTMFGPSGSGFQRINIACPRATLEKALLQLEHALS